MTAILTRKAGAVGPATSINPSDPVYSRNGMITAILAKRKDTLKSVPCCVVSDTDVRVHFSCNIKFFGRKCCVFSAIDCVITFTECVVVAGLVK